MAPPHLASGPYPASGLPSPSSIRPGPSASRPSPPGKQMIETYFDFRLYRLWKSRQHSKLLDFDDVL